MDPGAFSPIPMQRENREQPLKVSGKPITPPPSPLLGQQFRLPVRSKPKTTPTPPPSSPIVGPKFRLPLRSKPTTTPTPTPSNEKYHRVPTEFNSIKARHAKATSDLHDIQNIYLAAIQKHDESYGPSEECPICSDFEMKAFTNTMVAAAVLEAIGLIWADVEVDLATGNFAGAACNIGTADEILKQVEELVGRMKEDAPVYVAERMMGELRM